MIENWAPLGDLPERHRDNGWRAEHGLGDRFVFLYTGTLGLKHRPELLYRLAEQRADDAEVVVISEGMGEQRLREMLRDRPLPNLRLLPFQPMDRYPDILGSADVLVALLEPTAGHVLGAVEGAVLPVRGPLRSWRPSRPRTWRPAPSSAPAPGWWCRPPTRRRSSWRPSASAVEDSLRHEFGTGRPRLR